MATLDSWLEYAEVPVNLSFPSLELIGSDHGDDKIVGSGEVTLTSLQAGTYNLRGRPRDAVQLVSRLSRMRENPYEALARFRLIGIDSHGVDWNCGWTTPIVQDDGEDWIVSGHIRSLVTDGKSYDGSSVELVVPTLGAPFFEHMLRSMLPAGGPAGATRQHELTVLGAIIRFELRGSSLFVTASTSEAMSHPHLENWLCEPFRIIFGMLVYPRLVARNFDDGRAQVWVRPVPDYFADGDWVALWRSAPNGYDREAFWQLYSDLLRMIALNRDDGTSPNFEANPVTDFFVELVLGSKGSRWVWALTLSSTIEGLAKRLQPSLPLGADPAAETASIDALRNHIATWGGDERLKAIASSAVSRSVEPTTAKRLRLLKSQGIITGKQFDAWQGVRNRVMHGERTSIYSDLAEDEAMIAMCEMIHNLTRALTRRAQNHSGNIDAAASNTGDD